MLARRQRRSRSVGPGLKLHRLGPASRALDDNYIGRYRARNNLSKNVFTRELQTIAKYFEDMIDICDNEVITNEDYELEPTDIQIPEDKLDLINNIQARILKESLDCKLSQEISSLKELEIMVSGEETITRLEKDASNALDLWKLNNQRRKDVSIYESKMENRINYLTEYQKNIEIFTAEFVNPILCKSQQREELLSTAGKKITEIEEIFNKLTGLNM
uniref:Centromere protein K n=1 Tax=Strongyloides stercoralis TaxID=6248 RepID=A0A0K0EDY2_STRER